MNNKLQREEEETVDGRGGGTVSTQYCSHCEAVRSRIGNTGCLFDLESDPLPEDQHHD